MKEFKNIKQNDVFLYSKKDASIDCFYLDGTITEVGDLFIFTKIKEGNWKVDLERDGKIIATNKIWGNDILFDRLVSNGCLIESCCFHELEELL